MMHQDRKNTTKEKIYRGIFYFNSKEKSYVCGENLRHPPKVSQR